MSWIVALKKGLRSILAHFKNHFWVNLLQKVVQYLVLSSKPETR